MQARAQSLKMPHIGQKKQMKNAQLAANLFVKFTDGLKARFPASTTRPT